MLPQLLVHHCNATHFMKHIMTHVLTTSRYVACVANVKRTHMVVAAANPDSTLGVPPAIIKNV
jgi:hypothetical protein